MSSRGGYGFSVFVGNLPTTTTSWDVENWLEFEQLAYMRVIILRDPATGQSKRCGFIRVAHESDLQPIIDRFHGAVIEGKQIRVSVAKKPAQRRLDTALRVVREAAQTQTRSVTLEQS